MQKILRYAYDIALFTINRYFTYFEAVNLERTTKIWNVSKRLQNIAYLIELNKRNKLVFELSQSVVLFEWWVLKGSFYNKILVQKQWKMTQIQNTIFNYHLIFINRIIIIFTWNIYKVKVMNTRCDSY